MAKADKRTPVAEWIAAALGLLVTVAVVGYLIAEGVGDQGGPPNLSVSREPAMAVAGRFVVPITVRNANDATAAGVEVRGALDRGGNVVEETSATFTYVPGRGETRGGLIFENNPDQFHLRLSAGGYELP